MKKALIRFAAVVGATTALISGGATAASANADFGDVWSCSSTASNPGVYSCSDNHGNRWHTDRPDWNPYFYVNPQ